MVRGNFLVLFTCPMLYTTTLSTLTLHDDLLIDIFSLTLNKCIVTMKNFFFLLNSVWTSVLCCIV